MEQKVDFFQARILWILCHYSHQPDDQSIVVGMTNGILSIKHRKSADESAKNSSQKKRRPAYRVFVKGKNYFPKQVRAETSPSAVCLTGVWLCLVESSVCV